MTPPPRFRSLSREQFPSAPEWFDPLAQLYNQTVGELVAALSRRLTRSENLQAAEKVGVRFNGGEFVTLANELPTSPKHVWITRLDRQDGGDITAPFSLVWSLTDQAQIKLKVLGVTPATAYLLTVAYE